MRRDLGLESPQLRSFLAKTRCISLGCFCAGASALEGLGLRGPAGPLDWVRSSAQGVAQLLEQSFQGFLDLEGRTSQRVGDCTVLSASWEGSFWHHDVTQPEVREAMLRRTERFLGSSEARAPHLDADQIDRSEHGLEYSRQTSASMWPAEKIAAWAKSERLSAALGRHAAQLAAAGGLAALDDAWLQAHGVVLASARTKALAAARVALAPRKQLRWGEVQLIHYEAEARSHKGTVHMKHREGFAVEGF
ncbi:unnamed protein product [Effrenium voratum]|nr:unnamed protein product [Effrenium voratum]